MPAAGLLVEGVTMDGRGFVVKVLRRAGKHCIHDSDGLQNRVRRAKAKKWMNWSAQGTGKRWAWRNESCAGIYLHLFRRMIRR